MKLSVDASSAPDVKQEGFVGWVYDKGGKYTKSTVFLSYVSGKHGRIRYNTADRLYIVASGVVVFEIEGRKIEACENDVIIVSVGSAYDFWVTGENEAKLFLIDSPAYSPGTEEKL